MISSFVKRPATTIMFVLFFVLLGLVSFFSLNIEQSPRIDFPLVLVNATYPGASPEEVENQVMKKIEDAVAEISELERMETRAYENFGYVVLEFKLSADVNIKSIEVKDKVEGILNELPDNIERPIVQRIDPFSQSVVDIILQSDNHSPVELYEYADKRLRNAFSRIEGVGEVEIFGGLKRQIRVDLIPDLMRRNFIGLDQVLAQLAQRNLTIPAGNIEQGKNAIAVRYEGEFGSVEEIANFRLTTSEGSQFKLSDIARVYDGAQDPENMARYNGKPVLTLAVKKISDGNDVNVSRGIRKVLPKIVDTLSDGMSMSIALDRSETIVQETNGTIESIVLGIALTVLILLFFTGDWRSTIIAAVVIPSSIVSALFLMEKSGFTINFITLLALATSLGTLIANSIVVIECVLSRLEKGEASGKAAIEGTRDAFVPVLAACGTNLVVFTPIAFMGGIIGQFMLQFGMTVVYTTVFSLLASFTLTPMMCAMLLSAKREGEKANLMVRVANGAMGWCLKEYRILFDVMFRFPIMTVILMIALFIGGFTVVPYVGNEFIPTFDQDRFAVSLTLPQGTQIEATAETAKQVEARLQELPEVEAVLSILGQNGQENATVTANLIPAAERTRSDVDLINVITDDLASIPGAEIEVTRGEGGGHRGGDISINVRGEDYVTMAGIADDLTKIMQDTGYFRSVTSSFKDPKLEAQFVPDQQKLEYYGISNAKVGEVVRAAIYGDDTNKYKDNGEEYDIVVEIDERYKTSLSSLDDITIVSQNGIVPLSQLGEFRVQKSVPTVLRRDRERIIQINAYLAKGTSGQVQAELTEAFKEVEVPQGYGVDFVGNAESAAETGQEIGKAFILAVLFTYMILAAILNSFIHPFTIAMSIATCYAGVFVALFFADSTINIASMLGIVMMVGIAVNNAILVLEEVEVALKRDPGIDLKDAIWIGVENKFRAVLMTSIAIVSGVVPQMWSPDMAKASMGTVLVGGVLASIFFTFFLTPVVYYYFERWRRWLASVRKRAASIATGPVEDIATEPEEATLVTPPPIAAAEGMQPSNRH